MVKTEIRLWYFCGQTGNRRSKNCSDFHFGGPEEDRTPEPFGCEPNALPAELRAHIDRFLIKKVAKNGFLRYSILKAKSGKSDEKLEGKKGPVMEVHMDANRTLSQGGKFSAHGPRCMV